jgi:UTP--glucose-1-phosphate uridylyltransferase
VLLADDIMHEQATVLEEMLKIHEQYGTSVIALKEVPPSETSLYGCVQPEAVSDGVVRVVDIVEKPSPDEAPSTLAVMGRYVFTPQIFTALEQVKPGKGGEIQLTDAIAILDKEEAVYGYVFEKGRYDVGNKLDYLRATVELALDRPDLGPAFREFLADIARREKRV